MQDLQLMFDASIAVSAIVIVCNIIVPALCAMTAGRLQCSELSLMVASLQHVCIRGSMLAGTLSLAHAYQYMQVLQLLFDASIAVSAVFNCLQHSCASSKCNDCQ